VGWAGHSDKVGLTAPSTEQFRSVIPEVKTMAEVIGYTRLSQDSDTSIERQKRHIREYTDQHEMSLERIYDDGERTSGWDEQRGVSKGP